MVREELVGATEEKEAEPTLLIKEDHQEQEWFKAGPAQG